MTLATAPVTERRILDECMMEGLSEEAVLAYEVPLERASNGLPQDGVATT